MKIFCTGLFFGTLITGVAVCWAGSWGSFASGVAFVLIPCLAFAGTVQKVLGWLHSFIQPARRTRLAGGRRASSPVRLSLNPQIQNLRTIPPANTVTSLEASPEATAIASALRNLGVSRKRAEEIARVVPAGTLEERFKRAVALAREAA